MSPERLSRRAFLAGSATALATAGCVTSTGLAHPPILDTHTHFYDPSRPQGVPWPDRNDAVLYRRVLPPDYRRLSDPLGVAGTVVVEASPWLEDNQWVLDLAEHDPFIVGFVGNLKPGRPEFRAELARFARNRIFRGIRIGGGDVRAALTNESVRTDLERLAGLGLSLDVLIGPDQVADVVAIAGRIPNLRVVIDHCANVRIDGAQPPGVWIDGIVACHYKPNVFMKVSGLVEGTGRTNGDAPTAVEPYRRVLDTIWGAFGEDRVIYGSNWPVSERFASLSTVQNLVQAYFESKGAAVVGKYFHRNAARVYQTVHR